MKITYHLHVRQRNQTTLRRNVSVTYLSYNPETILRKISWQELWKKWMCKEYRRQHLSLFSIPLLLELICGIPRLSVAVSLPSSNLSMQVSQVFRKQYCVAPPHGGGTPANLITCSGESVAGTVTKAAAVSPEKFLLRFNLGTSLRHTSRGIQVSIFTSL